MYGGGKEKNMHERSDGRIVFHPTRLFIRHLLLLSTIPK
jgi:hypothetical protein